MKAVDDEIEGGYLLSREMAMEIVEQLEETR